MARISRGQRLYSALNGKQPDKVPVVPKIWVDLAANLTGTDLLDVITEPAAALGAIAEAAILCGCDAARQFHFPRRKIEVDGEKVYELGAAGRVGEIDLQGGLATWLYDAKVFNLEDPAYMAYHHFWTANEPFVGSIGDARRMAVPDKKILSDFGWERRQREAINRYGDELALIGDCSSATMAFYVCMRGMNLAMFDLIEERQLVHAVMEKGEAIAISKGKLNLDMGLKILRLNDSVGNMTVISPEHWREFVFPHMKSVCDELHSYDDEARIYCHICGNVLPIAEDLVTAGIDCIGPLDPLGGMTPGQVRERVGNAVSLMGGVNTLSFVEKTPNQIIEEAHICIEEAGAKGGYVLGSGCVVPRSAPADNLLALRTAADTYSRRISHPSGGVEMPGPAEDSVHQPKE